MVRGVDCVAGLGPAGDRMCPLKNGLFALCTLLPSRPVFFSTRHDTAALTDGSLLLQQCDRNNSATKRRLICVDDPLQLFQWHQHPIPRCWHQTLCVVRFTTRHPVGEL